MDNLVQRKITNLPQQYKHILKHVFTYTITGMQNQLLTSLPSQEVLLWLIYTAQL